VDRAFAYLADPGNRPEWQSSLRRVADVVPAGGDVLAAGTTWTDVTVVPGVRPRMRTTVSDSPYRWVEEGSCGPFRARLELVLTADGGGCRVVAEFTVSGAGVGAVVTRGSRAAVASDLRRAARAAALR
jgi:hypothetical protein